MPDPFFIGEFAKHIFQELAHQASLLSGLENRQNLEWLHLFYGAHLYKCLIQNCLFSVKGFRFKAEYDLHSKYHEKKFKCHMKSCSYSEIGFATDSELGLHVSRHSTSETITDRISNLRLSQDPLPSPRQRRRDELFEDAVASGDMEYVASAIEDDELMISEYRKGKSTLGLAIEKNQVQIVEFLLDRGVAVNVTGRHYSSANIPLELAIECSSIEIVRALLLRNANQGTIDRDGNALCRAIYDNDMSKIELLLGFGADPLSGTSQFPRFLQLAVYMGNPEITRLLIDRFACSSRSFQNALIKGLCAAEKKDSENFQLVLKACNEGDIDWSDCLVRAVYYKRYECAQVALEQAADLNRPLGEIGEERADRDKNKTALMFLVTRMSKEAALFVKLLLEKGADPSIRSGKPLSSYRGAKNIQKWLNGVTWEELVQANAHKVVRTSDSQSPATNPRLRENGLGKRSDSRRIPAQGTGFP